jgi:hypothetical protein
LNLSTILNYDKKELKRRSKREIAPDRVSKFGRSSTVVPVARPEFKYDLENVNPPTVTSIDAIEAGDAMRRAKD